jgi:hypothetical protein
MCCCSGQCSDEGRDEGCAGCRCGDWDEHAEELEKEEKASALIRQTLRRTVGHNTTVIDTEVDGGVRTTGGREALRRRQ